MPWSDVIMALSMVESWFGNFSSDMPCVYNRDEGHPVLASIQVSLMMQVIPFPHICPGYLSHPPGFLIKAD
jgi:hypothetical protein